MSKYIIIGGVAGGASTVARLRRLDEKATIILLERGEYISYANCGLPYYIGDVISDRDKLFVQTPAAFSLRFNIDVRILSEAISIDKEKKEITIKNLRTGETYTETYDKLVLSPGAEPIKPPLKGIDIDGIFTIRNVPDTDRIKNYINANKVRRAIVVGAGFIGLEMAENLHHLGVNVTIVEMSEQVMGPLDFSMATLVHQHLKTKEVEFYLKDGIASFEKTMNAISVTLNSGKKISADMVILSIGVKPDSKLAKEAGLDIGITGGIKVNEYLQTSNEHIFAVGDAIEFPSPITNQPTITYLAGPANKQGRIVANNLVKSTSSTYHGSISTAIAKVFDLTVASTGVSAKVLRKYDIPYIASTTHSSSHAGYYPDALPLTIKICFSPTDGRLFGAQLVGYDGVDKRCDLFATVVKNKGTIYDLIEIEHAYAPPFSSAKDPVNIAGYVAENILNGTTKVVYWNELMYTNNHDFLVIDIRTPDEFMIGTIPGAINIPLDEVRNRLPEIPRNRKIVLFCGVGQRAYLGCRILMQHGYEQVYNLSGGFKTFEHATMKQSNEDIFERDYIGKDDMIYQTDVETKALTGNFIKIDACGLQCPGPIQKLKATIETGSNGDTFTVTATDPGFLKDVKSWCNVTGNQLISVSQEKGKIEAVIQKTDSLNKTTSVSNNNGQTLVVFSDDMDKALASFVLANGGAASGKKVTMFFTFWGLNVIKKQQKPAVKKDFMGFMFGKLMAKHSQNLKLSKLNMLGIGSMMMKMRMKNKKVDSLDIMIQQAIDNGITMIACNMSMDIMGVTKEELIDHVELGGVAAYIEKAQESNINLFV